MKNLIYSFRAAELMIINKWQFNVLVVYLSLQEQMKACNENYNPQQFLHQIRKL